MRRVFTESLESGHNCSLHANPGARTQTNARSAHVALVVPREPPTQHCSVITTQCAARRSPRPRQPRSRARLHPPWPLQRPTTRPACVLAKAPRGHLTSEPLCNTWCGLAQRWALLGAAGALGCEGESAGLPGGGCAVFAWLRPLRACWLASEQCCAALGASAWRWQWRSAPATGLCHHGLWAGARTLAFRQNGIFALAVNAHRQQVGCLLHENTGLFNGRLAAVVCGRLRSSALVCTHVSLE